MLKRPLLATTNALFLMVAVALALYLVIGIAGRSLQLYSLKREEARLQREISSLEVHAAALAKEQEYLKSEAFLEKAAREELNLIKPGETAVVVISGAPSILKEQAPEEKEPNSVSNWWRWWSLFLR